MKALNDDEVTVRMQRIIEGFRVEAPLEESASVERYLMWPYLVFIAVYN